MTPLGAVLAVLLMALSPRCGDPAASSAGAYGPSSGVPPISENVSSDGTTIAVGQSLGDRMFTSITSRYDARTFALTSAERSWSCCGSAGLSAITVNTDGSYDIESEILDHPGEKNARKESILHFQPHNMPLVLGGSFFIPWLYHSAHASRMIAITFDPLRTENVQITPAAPDPYPDGVPHQDEALLVTRPDGQNTTLWYNPCTFRLDAYGDRASGVVLQSDLVY